MRAFTLLSAALLVGIAGSAASADFIDHSATAVAGPTWNIHENAPRGHLRVPTAGSVYSNVTNFPTPTGGTGVITVAPGGSTAGITRMLMDDLGTISYPIGAGLQNVLGIRFGIANTSATDTFSMRPRVRFWYADGAGGAPGTYYTTAGAPGIIGFSFNPISMGPGQATIFTGTVGPGAFNLPQPAGQTLWMGWTFDNAGGATATDAQLNQMAVIVADAPDVGTSADQVYLTTAAGSFFGTANPAGTLGPITGLPTGVHSNLANELFIPTPASISLLGLSGLVALRRRR